MDTFRKSSGGFLSKSIPRIPLEVSPAIRSENLSRSSSEIHPIISLDISPEFSSEALLKIPLEISPILFLENSLWTSLDMSP